jgi:pimeloyl-ACP methyl ester carboxylesterase
MPTLILLPGLACDAGLFHHQALALKEAGHEVIVSGVHTRCDTLPAMATALLAETPGELLLIGASMGGMLALEAARQAPQRVRGIALLGSTARPDTPELVTLRTQAIALFEAGRMDEVLRANVMFAFHPLHARDEALVGSYLAMIRRAGAEQLIHQNRAVMTRADLRPALPRITCPVLVVVGEADALTTPDQSREMAAALPGARLEVVPGAGHMLTMEQPARVSALLLRWLTSISA